MILAGTGSRSLATADETHQFLVRRALIDLLDQEPCEAVISGMAEGFDETLARCALSLGLPLWCAVPNRGYGAYYWGKKSLTGLDREDEFQKLIRRADRVIYVMEDIHRSKGLYFNGKHANFVRNDYMVKTADRFLVYNPSSSGTKQCLASIKKAEKPYTLVEVPR